MNTPKLDSAVVNLDKYAGKRTTQLTRRTFWILISSHGWHGPYEATGAPMNALHNLIEAAISENIALTISTDPA